MGRKPNQLILEYFIRGPKLEDASNRYQHTCKACGEKFPKGRIDSLTNHLVKKCQAIATHERQKVLMRLHELPVEFVEGDANKDAVLAGQKGRSANPSYSTRPTFDSLNVLAEASRQVSASDQPNHPHPAGYTQAVTVGGQTIIVDPAIDPALEAESYQHVQENETGDLMAGVVSVSATASLTPAPNATAGDQASSASPSLAHDALSADNARQSSQLSLIAASASEMVPQSLVMDHETETLADGLSRIGASWPGHQLSTSEQLLFDSLQEHDPTLTSATQRAASYPRPIAMNPNSQAKGFVNDFGNDTKPSKPKVRGRFSPGRRKEVQEVRKQGACIRCRMLKKPCSGETPCSTCASVESARLWKQPCIRTRLVEEFELYATGLHTTLAYHDVNAVKNQVNFEHFTGRIEAAHFDDSAFFVTFVAQIGYKPAISAIDPQLQALVEDGQFQGPTQELYLLDNDGDDLPGKLELYIKRMAASFYEQEPSPFMRPTLMLASEMCQSKKDLLLERVLELWVATHILADVELHWKTFANATLPPASINTLAPSTDEGRLPINESTNPEAYTLLSNQLRAATEKRAGQLGKLVMNDLERRLLQRQQTGWFETFLVAVILLNCVERTCWLFHTWDNETFASRWPLDRRPQHYANQGDRFSDILQMILRMRGLPPKTAIKPDTGVLKASEGSDENASRWFDMIQITPMFLEQRRNTEVDMTDSRSLDLKYVSKLLQAADSYS